MATTCLYSVVKNVSGAELIAGLPPHNKKLASGAEATIFGNVLDGLVLADRGWGRRRQEAFVRDLNAGRLQIVRLPNPVIYDETLDASGMLHVDNGTVSIVDPCWDNSSVSL